MKKRTASIILFIVIALTLYMLFGPSCYMTDKKAIKLARSFCDSSGYGCSKFLMVKPSRGEHSTGYDRKLVKFEKTEIGIDCKTENIVFIKRHVASDINADNKFIPVRIAENIANEQLKKVNLSDCSYIHLFAMRREKGKYRFIFDSVLSYNPKYASDRGSGFIELDASNGNLLLYNYSGGKWCSPDVKLEKLNDVISISEAGEIGWKFLRKLAKDNGYSIDGVYMKFISLDNIEDNKYLWEITFTEADEKGKVPADLRGLKIWINAYNGQFSNVDWFGKWEESSGNKR